MSDFLVILFVLGAVISLVGVVWVIIDLVKKNGRKLSLITLISGVVLSIAGFGGLYILESHIENTPLVLSADKSSYWINDDANSITIPVKVTKGAEISGYDDGGSSWKLKKQTVKSDVLKLKVKDYGSRLDIKLKETLGDRSKDILFSVYPAAAEKPTDSDSEEDVDYDDDDESDLTSNYGIGESVEFESGEKVTVNSIEDTSSVALADPAEGVHAVSINITVENTSDSPIDFNAQNFDAYDENDELSNFDANTYDGNIPNSIAAGMKATMTLIYGSKGNAKSVTFGDTTWSK